MKLFHTIRQYLRTRQARSGDRFWARCFVICLALGLASAAYPEIRAPEKQRLIETSINGQWIGNAISYGPYRDGQHPDQGPGPSREEIEQDVLLMHDHWQLLRTYSSGDPARKTLEAIRKHALPMRVMVGAWIAPEITNNSEGMAVADPAAIRANREQVEQAIRLANEFPDLVWAISVGNETQVEWSGHRVKQASLINYIRQVRDAISQPVTTADDFLFWLSDAGIPVANEVDFILTHIYAMWRKQQLEVAVAYTRDRYAAVKERFPNHPVVIGEAGWATKKHTDGDQGLYVTGKPGLEEQTRFVSEYLAWTTSARVMNFLFSAFDEQWKGGPHPNEIEKHWGVYYSNRQPKPAVAALPNRSPGVSKEWIQRVQRLNWICYTPTNANPGAGIEPPRESVKADLKTLRSAGFNGLITYASAGWLGRELPQMAADAGFEGMIPGIWTPRNQDEQEGAIQAAKHPIVLGTCTGNEGLGRRYSMEELMTILSRMRIATSKPVTTTEEIGDYHDLRLLDLGDWVFPNSHPIFHSRKQPDVALRWTVGAYDQMRRETERFVWFKEVGVPTGGGDEYNEQGQYDYYTALAKTPVFFAYFEAFNIPWKTEPPVEPHWGLFSSTREPKRIGRELQSNNLPIPAKRVPWRGQTQQTDPGQPRSTFWVFRDDGFSENHFSPVGRQGDCGDVHVERDCFEQPFEGETCLHIWITTNGAGPNKCNTAPPCRWAGLVWQHPAGNWGADPQHRDAGFDLRGYTHLRFAARARKPVLVRFSVGGADNQFGDSIVYPVGTSAELDTQWREYSIDLRGSDLSHVISGFALSTNWDLNPDGIQIFLDNIRYETMTD